MNQTAETPADPLPGDAPEALAATDAAPPADVEQLRAELTDARDKLLRTQAELENVRKRTKRELDDERRFAALPLVAELLPVLDNLRRALEAAERSGEQSGLVDGVKMVAGQLDAALARVGCRPIEALHQPFDPHLHAALTQQPTAEHPPGTVVLVVQSGYLLHDRVVRPAQVIVASAPPAADPAT